MGIRLTLTCGAKIAVPSLIPMAEITTGEGVFPNSYILTYQGIGDAIDPYRKGNLRVTFSGNDRAFQSWESPSHTSMDWLGGGKQAVISDYSRPDRSRVERIQSYRQRMFGNTLPTAQLERKRRVRIRNLEFGDEADFARLLAFGEINSWEETRRVLSPRRSVKIGISIVQNCWAGEKEQTCRGVAAMALADWLVANGYSVSISGLGWVAGFTTGYLLKNLLIQVPLVREGEPMDLASVSLATMHLGFFRSILLPDILKFTPEQVNSWIGSAQDMSISQAQALGVESLITTHIDSEEKASRWVRDQISLFSLEG